MKRMPPQCLYLVTDRKMIARGNLKDVVLSAIKGGVDVVQLREKECSAREFVQIARELKSVLEPFNVPLIINDRLDVAKVVNADGVHIGQTDIEYSYARAFLGYNFIIGVSVENMQQANEAIQTDVDYISVSPVFLTPTKPEAKNSWGIEGLKELRKLTNKYIVAIGGINSTNAFDVLKAGADAIAVVSAICASSDPEKAAKELKNIINNSKKIKNENN